MTPEAKKFLGDVPQTLLEEDVSFGVHLTNTCMHFRALHYALSDFLVETRFDPWTTGQCLQNVNVNTGLLRSMPNADQNNGIDPKYLSIPIIDRN